jgi:hypothetical protein
VEVGEEGGVGEVGGEGCGEEVGGCFGEEGGGGGAAALFFDKIDPVFIDDLVLFPDEVEGELE